MRDSLRDFDPDLAASPVQALRVDVSGSEAEVPVHRHRKGQLVLALHGGVTCEVPEALWIVPPHCAVWIPGGMPHSNRATANAQVYFLFVDPEAATLPAECCTLSITPMLREMIRHLAGLPPDYPADGPTARLAGVLLEELARMPVERLHLPISWEPRLRRLAKALADDPSDRSTLAQWADRLAMSERSLARLLVRETGLTFGRWRQQLHLVVALGKLAAGASVQQVSAALGYESVTAFITMFKKALGKPPAKYFASIAS
ncbi:AraC family transcriptional regulator [Labrys wisconsinensis]|uniref:AraC family transcriptional regulator n=1 Tax=Labrys wisconsinensis TaxID=425677 RepID=UPI00351F9E59